jgi:GYF domain 2
MGVRWYYGRGSDIVGPVSAAELSGLAETGQVLPTDTVWQEGVEDGVPAARVRNLFRAPAPAPADSPASDPPSSTVEVSPPVEPAASEQPAEPAAEPAEPKSDAPVTSGWQAPPKGGRAVAGKGVVLVSQDGATVKYRGKCGTCGREDSSWKSIPIPRGSARVGFFCPKCRKRREGEILGYR